MARVVLLRRIMLLYSDCEGATCATVSHLTVRASVKVPISALNSVKLIRPAAMLFGFLVPPSIGLAKKTCLLP